MAGRARALVAGLVLALVTGLAGPLAAEDAAACDAIRAACADAGFVEGRAAPKGGQVGRDCLTPILKGRPTPRRALHELPQVDAAVVAACAGRPAAPAATKARATTTAAAPAADGLPNIVYILADDMSFDLMTREQGILEAAMPNLARMIAEGTSFDRYFVTESLCCPSRASILTGKMPHNSGVLTNTPPDGGLDAFLANGNEPETFAVALEALGYRTALFGKYLNGYRPNRAGVPQGWTDWAATGNGYKQYNTLLNVDGTVEEVPGYLTDDLARRGTEFIADAAGGPFLLWLSAFAPHSPYTPPERYLDSFNDLDMPRSPAYAARPDADAPDWLQAVAPLLPREERRLETIWRDRLRSMKAIDDMIGAVLDQIEAEGLAGNTYVIFNSDNGFHLGDYSLRPGKMTPYDTDIRVPLVVTGPGVPAGVTRDQIVMNVDLGPTFTDLAGTEMPAADGTSLVPLLKGAADWPRQMAVVEHKLFVEREGEPDSSEPKSGQPPDYTALRMPEALFVDYFGTGEIAYYDLAADPFALRNIAGSLPPEQITALQAAARANRDCAGPGACLAAQGRLP